MAIIQNRKCLGSSCGMLNITHFLSGGTFSVCLRLLTCISMLYHIIYHILYCIIYYSCALLLVYKYWSKSTKQAQKTELEL